MKVLKALLAVLTTLAVALTAILLFWQDKSAPRYIKIYENEQELFLAKTAPRPSGKTARPGCFCVIFLNKFFQSYSALSRTMPTITIPL